MEDLRKSMTYDKAINECPKALCSACKRITNHAVLRSVDLEGENEATEWSESHQIVQCKGCETLTFRRETFLEAVACEEDDGIRVSLYPKRSETTRAMKSYRSVPIDVRRIYRESVDCFNNDSLILCAVGIRGILEGICADQKVKGGKVERTQKNGKKTLVQSNKLDGKIAGLHQNGILNQKMADDLHELRFLGNDATHELARPSEDDLKLALDIAEHILDHLYEMPTSAARLRSKRKAHRKSQL